jgi:hypothetical protein
MIDKIIGRDPNCFTGADCWNYDYSDRWLSILLVITSIVVITKIAKKIFNKNRGDK